MSKKILIVDDDKDWVMMLTTRLQHEGYQVEAAFDAIQAHKQALGLKPDLILLDIMMPAGGGFGALRNLRNSTKTFTVPVIIITARGDKETKETAEGSGISGYFIKPLEMDALIKKMNEVLTQ
jgi:DNA-binding response OmpR family regulator